LVNSVISIEIILRINLFGGETTGPYTIRLIDINNLSDDNNPIIFYNTM